MSDKHSLRLTREQSLVLVVDVQERLAAAMHPEAMQRVERAIITLVEGSKLLGVPLICTEQYPKGLGPTVGALLAALPKEAPRIEKTDFSCYRPDAAAGVIDQSGRRQIVICGMETHVCVFQTVRDLVDRGYVPHVMADAVISRTQENRSIGLGLMERCGAVVTSAEAVLFDWMGSAKDPQFKSISRLLK